MRERESVAKILESPNVSVIFCSRLTIFISLLNIDDIFGVQRYTIYL